MENCPPIVSPAFKNNEAKPVPENVSATPTTATMNPSLVHNIAPAPVPNLAASPLAPSHCHHSSWHGMPPHPSYAGCTHTCNSYYPQPNYHSCQPQPVHHSCHPHPPAVNTYSQPPTGPASQSIGPVGQNYTAVNDFCTAHGLDEAARDSLKRLMSGVPPGV